jgi:type VI secretion system secreted protein VgrG
VQADRKVTVHGNETIEVTGTRKSTIGDSEEQTFNADRNMTVEGANTDDIKGAHKATYHGGRNETVENGDTLTVERSDKTTMVGGEYNVVAVKRYGVTSGEIATCDLVLKEGVVTITAENEINLVCGDASLSLKKDGTVTIQGKNALSAIGARSGLELAAAGAKLAGDNATVSGKTMTEITGDMVKIN